MGFSRVRAGLIGRCSVHGPSLALCVFSVKVRCHRNGGEGCGKDRGKMRVCLGGWVRCPMQRRVRRNHMVEAASYSPLQRAQERGTGKFLNREKTIGPPSVRFAGCKGPQRLKPNLIRLRLRRGLEAAPFQNARCRVARSRARENCSFAPLGLSRFPRRPTAYAVGCTLTPLRG